VVASAGGDVTKESADGGAGGAASPERPRHLVLVVLKQTGKSEDLDAHTKLAFAVCDLEHLADNQHPVTLACKLLQRRPENEASAADASGLKESSVMPQSCLLGLSVIRAERGMNLRQLRLSRCQPFSGEAVASAAYRFHALGDKKVLVNVQDFIPRFNASIPCALIDLLLKERLPPVLNDRVELETRKKEIEKRIEIYQKNYDRLYASVESLEDTAQLANSEDMTRMEYFATELDQQQHRLHALLSELESLRKMEEKLGEYDECRIFYLNMLQWGSGSGPANPLSAADLDFHVQELTNGLKPVASVKARDRFLLKRSALKKSSLLRFMPTNLNIELLQATEMGAVEDEPSTTLSSSASVSKPSIDYASILHSSQDQPLQSSHVSPPPSFAPTLSGSLSIDLGDVGDAEEQSVLRNSRFGIKTESTATFPSITFGCSAAHCIGFQGGGLRRVMASSSAAQRRRAYLRLHDWTLTPSAENFGRSSTRLTHVDSVLLNYLSHSYSAPPRTRGRTRSAGPMPAPAPERAGEMAPLKRTLGRSSSNRGVMGAVATGTDMGLGDETSDISVQSKEILRLVERLDSVVCQLLVVAVSQFSVLLACAAAGSLRHRHILPRVLKAGFLVSIQSLLSTRGDELGMLEDMVAAAEWLSSVKLRLVRRRNHPPSHAKAAEAAEAKAPPEPFSSSSSSAPSSGTFSRLLKSPKSTSTPQPPPTSPPQAPPAPPPTTSGGSHPEFFSDLSRADSMGSAAVEFFLESFGLGHLIAKFNEIGISNLSHVLDANYVSDEDLRSSEVGISDADILRFRTAVTDYNARRATSGADGRAPASPPTPSRFSGSASSAQGGGAQTGENTVNVGWSNTSPGIWMRRSSANDGSLVVDIEVDDSVVRIVNETKRRFHLSDGSMDGSSYGRGHLAGISSKLSSLEVGEGDGNFELIHEVSLEAVIFQQGINEMQVASNTGITGNPELQNAINQENFARLTVFVNRYRQVALEQATSAAEMETTSRELEGWNELLDSIHRATARPSFRVNVHLILHTSDLCRQFSGAHCICCKSGKDRTSMGVTLEEARFLCDQMNVIGGRKACKIVRRFGVRRTNVEMNTGQQKYAFNTLQRSFLPKCYQPPGGTYGGNVST